MEDKKSAKI